MKDTMKTLPKSDVGKAMGVEEFREEVAAVNGLNLGRIGKAS